MADETAAGLGRDVDRRLANQIADDGEVRGRSLPRATFVTSTVIGGRNPPPGPPKPPPPGPPAPRRHVRRVRRALTLALPVRLRLRLAGCRGGLLALDEPKYAAAAADDGHARCRSMSEFTHE